MNLKNKSINFLGDSITFGAGTSEEAHCFASLLMEQYHLKAARNYGISGTRYAKQRRASDNPECDRDFCSRVCEMDADADVVIVFGGTNDFGHSDAPLGACSDRTADTFHGACHTLYASLIERYPKSTIVILTPLHRIEENSPFGDGQKLQPGSPLSTYVDIIRKTAVYYDLPVLDLFAEPCLDPNVPLIQQCYLPDGLHPNDAGHRILADIIGEYLENHLV